MTKKCNACVLPVSPHELKCAVCKHLYHLKCAKVDVNDAVIINKENNNIHWFCDDCSILLQSDFLRSLLTKINKLETVVEKIDKNMSVLIESQSKKINLDVCSTTPSSNTRSKSGSLKRRRDLGEVIVRDEPSTKKATPEEIITEENSHNKTFRNALVNGNIAEQESETVVAPQVIEERRWIFVSRLNPNTTTDTVSLWLKSKLKTDDILCFPLIPRGFQINELKMISFKMGIPISLLEAAKRKDNWPPGVQIRDFIVRAVSIPTIPTVGPMDQDEEQPGL